MTQHTCNELLATVDRLAATIRSEELRDHLVALLLLRFLSENYERSAKRELGPDLPGREPALSRWYRDNPAHVPLFESHMLRKTRYIIRPHHLWPAIVHTAHTAHHRLSSTLRGCFSHIERDSADLALTGLFSQVDTCRVVFDNNTARRDAALRSMVNAIDQNIPSPFSRTRTDACRQIIRRFSNTSRTSSPYSRTPQCVSDILSGIVTLDSRDPKRGRRRMASIMDFACGSGSLLLDVRKHMAPEPVPTIFGQERDARTHNLARMNMLLHGLKDTEFHIFRGDSLRNDCDMLLEENPSKRPSFDAIVSAPPFTLRCSNLPPPQDIRFCRHGLPPRSTADAAFLLHGLHYLHRNGTMAIVLHPGILFRQGPDAAIRRSLLCHGHIDTVIALPPNLFPSTGAHACILVLKKNRPPCDVLFIDATRQFHSTRHRYHLSTEHVDTIVDTYRHRPAASDHARTAPIDQIRSNDWNLNVSLHVPPATGIHA